MLAPCPPTPGGRARGGSTGWHQLWRAVLAAAALLLTAFAAHPALAAAQISDPFADRPEVEEGADPSENAADGPIASPRLTRYVLDHADILPGEAEQALLGKLVELNRRTGRQLVVVTLPSLGDEDIADVATRIGRDNGVGDRKEDDGILFLVAPNERRMHIATGLGIEATLTDAQAGRIIRDVVAPLFKQGDYPGGIAAGVAAIGEIIALPPEEAAQRAEQLEIEAARRAAERQSEGSSGAFWFWVIILILFFVLPSLGSSKQRGRRSSYSSAPIIIWGGPGWGGSSGSSWGGGGFGSGGGGSDFGGFSGGGGDFGGGGASGDW